MNSITDDDDHTVFTLLLVSHNFALLLASTDDRHPVLVKRS